MARTAKVQPVPKGSKDTSEMPDYLKVLGDRGKYDAAREALRPWAVKGAKYLHGRPGKTARVWQIGLELFEGGEPQPTTCVEHPSLQSRASSYAI